MKKRNKILIIVGGVVVCIIIAIGFAVNNKEDTKINHTDQVLVAQQLPQTPIFTTPANSSNNSSLTHQTQLIDLTQPLLDKYNFLNNVINKSLPFIESAYQGQEDSIGHLQQLQSIEDRSNVAEVLTAVQDESTKLSKIIVDIKGMQDQVNLGIEILDTANETFKSKPIDEDFTKFVNNQIVIMDGYIEMFNPNNQNNIVDVVNVRATKLNELQDALIKSLGNTQ